MRALAASVSVQVEALSLDVSAMISARTFVIECCNGRSSVAIPTAAELLRRKLAKLVGMHAAVLLL